MKQIKQNININQLNELSERGKEKLHKYLGIEVESGLDLPKKYFQTVLLNIGEMIEFIFKNSFEHDGIVFTLEGYLKNSFCDKLWEEVKKILESKDEQNN